MTVTNSTFSGNRANGDGGAIFGGVGSTTVTNSTFIRNSAFIGGGIFLLDSGSLTVTNSTFTGNSARFGSGSGIGAHDGSVDQAVLLRNTILGNSPSGVNCRGAIHDGGHNLDDGESCGFSPVNGSLRNTDPQLDPAGLQDNGGPTQTVAVCTAVGVPTGCTAASPAIDAGDAAICAMAPVNNRGQRGFMRPGAGHAICSIGAFEAGATCNGDCDAGGSVTIDELLTLVNIALGSAPPSACPHGPSSAAAVDIALIIQAVNSALNGCGG